MPWALRLGYSTTTCGGLALDFWGPIEFYRSTVDLIIRRICNFQRSFRGSFGRGSAYVVDSFPGVSRADRVWFLDQTPDIGGDFVHDYAGLSFDSLVDSIVLLLQDQRDLLCDVLFEVALVGSGLRVRMALSSSLLDRVVASYADPSCRTVSYTHLTLPTILLV